MTPVTEYAWRPLETKKAFPCGSDPSIGNASSYSSQSALTSLPIMTAIMVDTINTPAIRINMYKSLLDTYLLIELYRNLTMKPLKFRDSF